MRTCLAMLAAAMLRATANPLYAAGLSCAQWLAYRTHDKSLAGQGLVFSTFRQERHGLFLFL